jgi:hypothetical protein
MPTEDVTKEARFGSPDDELLPILRCPCGVKYAPWAMTISVYADHADPMPCCGRRLVFENRVRILQVHGDDHGTEVPL